MRAAVLIGALCAVFLADAGRLRAQRSPASAVVDAHVPVVALDARPQDGRRVGVPADGVSITPADGGIEIDLARLSIHPIAASAFSASVHAPAGVAIGRGKASMSVAPDVVDQNTTSAFVTVVASFVPGESVRMYVNGVLVGTFVTDFEGRLRNFFTTGPGYGYVVLDAVGVTSNRRAAGVVHVAATGPYLPGVAIAPHAIFPQGTTVSVYGRGFQPNSTVTLYRNGLIHGGANTDAGGRFSISVHGQNTGPQSSVFSASDGTAGSLTGQSYEERYDAGGGTGGDQNVSRALVDRAVINSTTGGYVGVVGEGFVVGESVDLSICGGASFTADPNGAVRFFLSVPSGAAAFNCLLTGGTSSRDARFSVLAHPSVANVRAIIAAPSTVSPGGSITVLVDRLPPNDTGTVYLDGVSQGNATTNALGYTAFTLPKPTGGFIHQVGWVGSGGGAQSAVLLESRPPFGDRDRDTRTDRTIFRPGSGTWYSALSGGGAIATGWGSATDIDVLGDYDGDATPDIAVWRPSDGTWYIVQSSDGGARATRWGVDGDIPLAGDIDGDFKDDLAIFRPGAGTWFFYKSTGGASVLGWGTAGDRPLLGDFDGDGRADPTVFRPTNGTWYSAVSNGGTLILGWGISADVPVNGDFDGDGRNDPTIVRNGRDWFVNYSSGGTAVVPWGTSGDIPVSGDFDGDGRSDFTVWRPSDGTWYTQFASGGGEASAWGMAGDRPAGRIPGS